MIAIIGIPVARSVHLGGGVEGTTARAANAAARAGATVQLVGKTGDDPAGDALLLALAAAGVGHVAVLRDAAHSTPIAQPTGAASEAEETALIDELLDDAAPAFEIVPVDAADRPSLEAADVELALRYLPDFRAIVVAEPLADGVVAVAAEAAAYGGAELVVVVAAGQTAPAAANALVLEAPRDDDEGAFATMLGELAAALDTGATAADAFREARDRVGVRRPAS